ALVLHAVFRPAGWLYGRFFPSLREGYAGSASTPTPAWLTVVILALVGAGALAGLAAIGHRWQDDGTRHLLARTCQALVGAGVVLAMVAVGVPKLIEVVRDVVGQLFQERDHKSAVEAAEDSARALGVSGGASLAGVIGTALWAVKARVADPTTVDQARRWIRRFRRLRRGLRRFIMSLAATLFGPLLLLSGALAFLSIGALNTPLVSGHGDWAEVLWWALPLLALALMWLFGDLQAWSLQPLYKRRLSDTFALRRVRRPGKEATAEPRPYSTWYLLSQSQPEDFPQLLVCAAANVNDYGATPTGSDVGGFVLSPTEVGGPLTGTVQTAVYEEAFGDRARDFTLPAAVGITGAAFSPAMGKMTRAPIRFLLALLNLRLGVWLPNPRRCEGSGAPAYRRFVGGPKLLYLIREMLGRHSLNDNYLYVSDGGHYENLGLVELLRRGCTTVWCVDATGERIDSFGTIGEAVQIARSELS
ncbi:MAG TPA: hypothetical protein VEI97_13640, partial [bacterium]|nr:hypothetical protein [bacterium]